MPSKNVATVLTVYGIETGKSAKFKGFNSLEVATVLTVYGIETREKSNITLSFKDVRCNSTYRLRY